MLGVALGCNGRLDDGPVNAAVDAGDAPSEAGASDDADAGCPAELPQEDAACDPSGVPGSPGCRYDAGACCVPYSVTCLEGRWSVWSVGCYKTPLPCPEESSDVNAACWPGQRCDGPCLLRTPACLAYAWCPAGAWEVDGCYGDAGGDAADDAAADGADADDG